MADGSPSLAVRLRRSAKAAGIHDSDPMAPFVEAMAELAEKARMLSPDAEADLVGRVEKASERAVGRGLPALGRHLDRRTVAIAAGSAALCLLIGGAAGWWWRGETVVLALDAGVLTTMPDGRRYVSMWLPPAERR
jgi:hypothetical protein